MKKIFTLLLVLGFFGLLSWQIYDRTSQKTKVSPRLRPNKVAIAVEVTAVEKATIRDIGLFTGSLYPRSQFTIAPKIAGRLEKLLVHIGDKVKNGRLIAILDSEELVQEVKREQAQLQIAQSKLSALEALYPKQIEKQQADISRWKASAVLAQKEIIRQEKLRDRSLSSNTEYERARERIQVAEAQLLSAQKEIEFLKVQYIEQCRSAKAEVAYAQAALNRAEVQLSYAEIKVRWRSGKTQRVVGERFVDEGAMLKISDPIVSILETDVLTGVISVTEKNYPKLHVGQVVAISTDAYPGKSFPGKVIRIAPLLMETSREARVEIEIVNGKQKLNPGMFIQAHIEFGRHAQATLVPRAALVKRHGQDGVFLVDKTNEIAKFVPVTTGIVSAGKVEILRPSLAGDVVTLGHHLLVDGSRVILPEVQPVKKSSKATKE